MLLYIITELGVSVYIYSWYGLAAWVRLAIPSVPPSLSLFYLFLPETALPDIPDHVLHSPNRRQRRCSCPLVAIVTDCRYQGVVPRRRLLVQVRDIRRAEDRAERAQRGLRLHERRDEP